MNFVRAIFLVTPLLLLGSAGCTPTSSVQADEEKETHYLTGKARITALDFRGAIEAFDEALVVNPRSASAHFQLGWLYAEKENDPAAAIYHYQKFLQLRPGSDRDELVKQHVFRLKQELAKAVLLPSTPGVQRDLEQLMDENRKLREELETTKKQLAVRGTPSLALEQNTRPQPASQSGSQVSSGGNAQGVTARAAQRTHKVQPGESPAAIARRYNVKLDEFMAVNPGLNPTRMQVGQVVNVPGT